jgi:hypothetical protein
VLPSLSGALVVVLPNDGDAPQQLFRIRTPETPPDMRRFAVYNALARGVAARLARSKPPSLVAIQGYTFGSADSRNLTQTEMGALVRQRMVERRWPVLEVPPCTLAKFITGDGHAPVAAFGAVLRQMHGWNCTTAQESIAYGLAHAARCVLEPGLYPEWQVRVLARLQVLAPVQVPATGLAGSVASGGERAE